MKNYSQNNEQQIILDFFNGFVGSFIDMGANDGITLSNTYALTLLGWRGTLVEASPKAYKRLVDLHRENKNLTLIECAVGAYNGDIVLHESGALLGNGDIALVSSTRMDEVSRWDSLKLPFEDVKVQQNTFKKMQEKSPYKNYDFLSIDIEGMELDVLPQIDFNELGVKLACIEFNGKQKEKYEAIMRPFGFNLIHENQENLIYIK